MPDLLRGHYYQDDWEFIFIKAYVIYFIKFVVKVEMSQGCIEGRPPAVNEHLLHSSTAVSKDMALYESSI